MNALLGLGVMFAGVTAYVSSARRYRVLWHPVAIVAAVTAASIAVAVAGEVLVHDGGSGVSGMLRRSAIGGLGWGVVIAIVVWTGRRLFVPRSR